MPRFEKRHKNVVLFFVAISGIYFNVFPYLLRIGGIDVESGYYNIEPGVNFNLLFLAFLNCLLFFTTLFLFQAEAFRTSVNQLGAIRLTTGFYWLTVAFAIDHLPP